MLMILLYSLKTAADNLKAVLFWYGQLSGLLINERKTKIIPVGVGNHMQQILELWDCQTSHLPETYLGAPLGSKYKTGHVWEDLLERFKRRLAIWKRKYLTKGSRMVLIMSTLASLPVYLM